MRLPFDRLSRPANTFSVQRSEHGQTMIIFAVIIVVLFIMVAIVVDLGHLRERSLQAQNAADVGALAGAQDLPATSTALASAASYAASTINSSSPTQYTSGCSATACYNAGSSNSRPTIEVTTPFNGREDDVHVRVCEDVRYSFARVIGFSSHSACRQATARVTRTTTTVTGASILVLKTSGTKTFVCSGSCNIDVGTGSIVANSTSSGAIDASGGTSITAGSIHGTLRTSGAAVVTCTSPVNPCPTDQNKTADPLTSLPAPAVPTQTYTGAYTSAFSPGRYTGTLTVSSATACLNPGLYFLENGLTVSGGSRVTMCAGTSGGVFFYNAGGKFTISGGSTVTITAPTAGPYAGVLVFQARTNTNTLTLSGGSGLSLPGTFYNPAGETVLSGGSSTADASGIGQIITDTLTVSGSSKIGPGFAGGGGGVQTGPPRVVLVQ